MNTRISASFPTRSKAKIREDPRFWATDDSSCGIEATPDISAGGAGLSQGDAPTSDERLTSFQNELTRFS
jgi:hypothetical protein